MKKKLIIIAITLTITINGCSQRQSKEKSSNQTPDIEKVYIID